MSMKLSIFQLLFCVAIFGRLAFSIEVETYELLMPRVTPHHDEQYLCTPIRISPYSDYYVVGFEPNATMHTAHHMLLYGCEKPGSTAEAWSCGGMESNEIDPAYPSGQVCAEGSQIIYAWAKDAPRLELPEGVGFHIGQNSHIKYLVLQVHYMHKFQYDHTDDSGVFLRYTTERLTKEAGVFLLGTGGVIPAKKTEHMEVACTMDEPKIMHPFAFRTHTHALGKVVSGYVVRKSQIGDEWTLLGKKNPQLPQMFYPVVNTDPIRQGDIIAARCTMVNDHDSEVRIGSTGKDEMCNFYLMYWVDNDTPLQRKYCFTSGPPSYYWSMAEQNFNRIPDMEASTL